MVERYQLGVYWGVRRESLEDCTQRLFFFLRTIAQVDFTFKTWFELGRSRKEALRNQVTIDNSAIQNLFLKSIDKSYQNSNLENDLGFRISLWSGGADTDSINLFVNCGCYSPYVGVNSSLIYLPYQGDNANGLLTLKNLTEILKHLINAWNPDWGLVTSSLYQGKPISTPNGPRTGWMLYLNKHPELLPKFPFPIQVQSINHEGSIIIATQERFTIKNLLHIETADEVGRILAMSSLV